MDKPNVKYIRFKSPLPFNVSEEQFIYVEDEFNPEVNKFIQNNYEKISKLFTHDGNSFAYIPLTQENILKERESFADYYYPDIPSDLMREPKNISAQDIYNSLFSFLIDEKEPLKPGFIQYKSTNDNIHTFIYFQINLNSENDLLTQIKSYFQNISRKEGEGLILCSPKLSFNRSYTINKEESFEKCSKEQVEFTFKKSQKKQFKFPSFKKSISKGYDSLFNDEDFLEASKEIEFEKSCEYEVDESLKEKADNDFPVEAVRIIEDIRLKINYLTQIGINEWVLHELLTSKTTQKLSKLLITNDFRIFLPDYNNREIHLTPLPKAVFLLFLNYPDGIMFKHLSNYKEELKNIYLKLSNRENVWNMGKSIDDLVDPTKNAINEKCSRIREAFIKEFDISLAENYFITGERYSPKRIKLNRNLVQWGSKI